ncbi:MAG: biopolymer transporter ExbD [Oligoflexia bacterium]|nr:biopolymer transporter ExbD [Oligoflexia bacterium]
MIFNKRGKGIPEMGELNLAPIMNLMVTLIPILLLSASFFEIVLLDTSLPVFKDQEQQMQEEDQEKPRLGLTVAIADEGFVVGGQGGLMEISQGNNIISKLGNGDLDYTTLSVKLYEIKQRFPDEWSVIIVPEKTTPFGDIVHTMDAVREFVIVDEAGMAIKKMMFPNVVIGGGIL